MEMEYEDKELGNLDRHDPFHSRSDSAGLKRQVPFGIISDHSDSGVSTATLRKKMRKYTNRGDRLLCVGRLNGAKGC